MENPMDCIVHGVAESRTRLMEFHFFFQTLGHGAERGRSHVLCKVIFLCGRKDHESLHKIFLHFLIFLFVFLLFSSMSGMNASFMSKFSKTGHWNFKFSSRKWCQLWKYEKKKWKHETGVWTKGNAVDMAWEGPMRTESVSSESGKWSVAPNCWTSVACPIYCMAFYCCCCCYCCLAMPYSLLDLIPWTGMEHTPPALEVQSLNHWITREVPTMWLLNNG